MKMTNTKNKGSAKKKLIPAAGSLIISACMLATSTYAWFTMNKDVSVTGMEVKAHAEEGLLINEVQAANSTTWDELAVAGDSEYTALRPASTKDLSNWWHANSKKSANDAGLNASGSIDGDTVALSSGTYYESLNSLTPYLTNGSGSAGTAAERNVYYKDASYGGTSGAYNNGEGYYVNYKYYIKSSSTSTMSVAQNNFQVKVTAAKNASSSGTSTTLDKALRVGVKIDSTYMIFAPLGGDASYYVTGAVGGTGGTQLDSSNSAGTRYTISTDYVSFNTSAALDIPSVTTDGKLVDVYIWFEGEDTNCKSDNLTEILDDLDINIYFQDATFD